jgi:hypothetical protein
MVRLVPGLEGKSRFWQGSWAALFFLLFAVSFWLTPDSSGHGTHTKLGLPPCPSVLMFGRPCPGCGMTTSFAYCAKGDVVRGFGVHPFGPILFLGWGLSAIAAGYGTLKGLRLDTDSKAFQWTLATFAILFFLYGGLRFQQGFPGQEPGEAIVQAASSLRR